MDWKKYFEEMIKKLRKEENQLNQKKKDGGSIYNSANGEYGIDHWLRELGIIINGGIAFLEFLERKKEISEQDARVLKYELGWLEADIWAIRLGTYPTLQSTLLKE